MLERKGKREKIFDEKSWNASESFQSARSKQKMQSRQAELPSRAQDPVEAEKVYPASGEGYG